MYLFIVAYIILLMSILTIYQEGLNIPSDNKIPSNQLPELIVPFEIAMLIGKNIVCNSVTCAQLNITSDRRIKKNIEPLKGETSLEVLRTMIPVRYQLKDCLKEVYGFIAQDLSKSIPSAVTSHTRVIPNIYDSGNCEGSVLTFSTFNTSELSYDSSKKLYDKIKIDEKVVRILEVLDETRVKLDTELSGKVFVFGQEVHDMLSIDNHQIFTVTTSAVKELDVKVNQLEEENKSLQERIRILEEKLSYM
jgi:hypothetical protein